MLFPPAQESLDSCHGNLRYQAVHGLELRSQQQQQQNQYARSTATAANMVRQNSKFDNQFEFYKTLIYQDDPGDLFVASSSSASPHYLQQQQQQQQQQRRRLLMQQQRSHFGSTESLESLGGGDKVGK